jgi:iron complex outermembrane receptor protein
MVTLESQNAPVHGASVLIVQLGQSTLTDSEGVFEFTNLVPGNYTVVVHLHGLSDKQQTTPVKAGEIVTLNFQVGLSPIRDEITVTARGREETTFSSFQTVATLESIELAAKAKTSLGEVLENQPGVAKRSFGPGSSRPVIRGFDGDRVLILQDGIRTGTLSSQSGDHGETIDPLVLERLEVVKGPATLLYGSNAIGGVVNAVTGHHQILDHPHTGLRGFVTGIGGSANAHAGAAAGFEYGEKNWLVWENFSGQKTGDYRTPQGVIENSETRVVNGSGGVGWYGDKAFASFGYGYDDSRYGVPFAARFEAAGAEEGPPIDLTTQRHNARFNAGIRNQNSFFHQFNLSLTYTQYEHQELEGEEVGTTFDNRQFVYRGVFDQKRTGPLTGSFGFSGMHRNYETTGEESLAPPVAQDTLAVFSLQELDFERVRFQFGGRLESNRYRPAGLLDRSFTGFSGAAGVYVPLWRGGAFVSNFTYSYRAPALEELYNNGPHIGNLTFEVGNPALNRERSNGIDFSLRHSTSRLRGEANFYYYFIQDFVFLAPTGRIVDGLVEADYGQGNSRFTGAEFELDLGLHPSLWLNLGMDLVDAELRQEGTPLPRIPPRRGRVGFDARYRGLSIKPELVLAAAQNELFVTETRTAGYAVANLTSSYTVAQQHLVHVISATFFNLGDRLYRNHLSFIKDLAPEIGRGVRLTYTVRFF